MRFALFVIAAALVAPAVAGPSAEEKRQAREIYQTIVEMDTSVEGGKTPEMAKYLADRFRDGGFAREDVNLIPMAKTAALVVRYRGDGSGGKPILLLAHMDVVPARREDWEREPFKLIEEKGYFFARGSEDNKSGLALIATTFLTLKSEGFKPTRDLIIVFSGDEETSGVSTQTLLKEHRALVDAEFAINSDAGGGQLSEDGAPVFYGMQTAEKTFASFTLTAKNPGGHSSTPKKENAIFDVADAVGKLRRYAFPVMWNETTIAAFRATGPITKGKIGAAMTRFARRPGDRRAAAVISADPFSVGQVRTTCIPTMLAGGHADNALPQRASVTVNCRIFPGVKVEQIQAQLQKIAGSKIEIAPLDTYVASDASPLRKDVVDAVRNAVHATHPGVRVVPTMSSGATDGVFYRAAGIPTYGTSELFMKDSDSYAHGLNERVPVDAFYSGLTHWRVLIGELAGKK
ncbi:MAG: M20/M25/M40 family metallo-hydrolase [Alphaproteobacteria bacterium]|nr:M20/M25/M40 family metallo-hydrolase [Alphaproteobacteria bacterium]